ncbi:MAG: nicotinate-nucleotide--dimethylbenzimidazole phosphoribosyltransferase [Eubacteriales bacterium]
MLNLQETILQIKGLNKEVMQQTKSYVDGLLKPVGSLGVLEDIVLQLSGIRGTRNFPSLKKAIVVFAGDHGICEEGITSAPQGVTALMTEFISCGKSGVGALAKSVGADITVVDVGVNAEFNNEKILNHKIRKGTNNIAKGPAMSREEAIRSLEVGIEVGNDLISKGYNILATGEMGIGNTTPSSAIFSVIGDVEPSEVVGVGANLSQDKIIDKIQVIKTAIELNKPDKNDGIDILSKVGGLEIGAMAGIMLAGASNNTPVLVDGYISMAAAAIAVTLNPMTFDYLICSHSSAEKGAKIAEGLLGFKPYLQMNMRLGEGSGAVLAFSVIEAAISMIKEMGTFAEAGIDVV